MSTEGNIMIKDIHRGSKNNNAVAIHRNGKLIIIQGDNPEDYIGTTYPIVIYRETLRYDMAELDHEEAKRMENQGIAFVDQDPYRPDDQSNPDLELKKDLYNEAFRHIHNLQKSWKNFAYHVHVGIVNMQDPGVDESGLLNMAFHSTRNWRNIFQPNLPNARNDINFKQNALALVQAYRDAIVEYPMPPYVYADEFDSPEALFDWARNHVIITDDWWMGYYTEEESYNEEDEGDATEAAIEEASNK